MNFSVLLSTYIKDNPSYLDLALASVFCQTRLPNEIVLVEDGPLTDMLMNVIDKWKGESIIELKIIKNESNMGLAYSLNVGLLKCSNEWVFRQDADDISYPTRFEEQLAYIEKNEVDILGSFADKVDETGNIIGLLKVPSNEKEIRKIIWSCPFIHPTVCFKKSLILKVGSYKKEAGLRQDDYDLWFRCCAAGLKMGNINKSLVGYRFSSDNIKRNSLKVGWARFKVGYSGCRNNKCGVLAYIGILVPLFRSLLPYPLNVLLYNLLEKVNPRNS